MKQLRKLIFWFHLIAGTLGGIVILIMSVTGVLLVYERQITAWFDRSQYFVSPAPGATPLPVGTLLAKVREVKKALPSAITLRSDPSEPAALNIGRDRVLFVNPYTGDVLGEGSQKVRAIFHSVTDWHRWLGAQSASRDSGRAITGACNLIFLFLVISGPYLWWPRTWTWSQFRSVTWFRRRLSGKSRDFNWHNVIGFWSALPLFVVVSSGVVISYPWASNLVYRAVGEQPPQAGGLIGQRPGAENSRSDSERISRAEGLPRGGETKRPDGVRREGAIGDENLRGGGQAISPPDDLNLERFDELWARAEQQVSDWQSISLRLPESSVAPLSFTIDRGNGGQPFKRAQLTLNRSTGEVVRWEPFSSLTLGRRIRSLLRFAHTGEVAGIFGQTLAGIAAGGSTVLVWTGLALAWRRFWAWQERKRSKEASAADSQA